MKGWTMKWKCTFEHRECSVFFSSLTEFGVSPLSSKLNQGGSKVAVETKTKTGPNPKLYFQRTFSNDFLRRENIFPSYCRGWSDCSESCLLLLGGLHKSHLLQDSLPKEGQKERERDQMIRGLGRYPVITSSGWLGGCKLCYNAVSWRVKSSQGWDLKGFLAFT